MNTINKKEINKENQKTITLIPIEEVLITGTIFKELHEPYKIIPDLPVAQTEEAKLLHEIQGLSIAAVDLNLYLDVHPTDSKGVELFNAVNKRLETRVKEYEDKYGALSLCGSNMQVPWSWLDTNWPWMGDQ